MRTEQFMTCAAYPGTRGTGLRATVTDLFGVHPPVRPAPPRRASRSPMAFPGPGPHLPAWIAPGRSYARPWAALRGHLRRPAGRARAAGPAGRARDPRRGRRHRPAAARARGTLAPGGSRAAARDRRARGHRRGRPAPPRRRHDGRGMRGDPDLRARPAGARSPRTLQRDRAMNDDPWAYFARTTAAVAHLRRQAIDAAARAGLARSVARFSAVAAILRHEPGV